MRFAILGSGAVGGYYGALLARAGHDVTFIARGAHLAAIRSRGLEVRSPLGDFTVHAPAEQDGAKLGPVDVVIFAVKAYSNLQALPLLNSVAKPPAIVLTLQNGVDSINEVAAVVGDARTLGGSAYVATALAAPGLIEQTGTHRRVVFGEVFKPEPVVSPRVQQIHEAFSGANIVSEPVADARVPIWEKFCYLSPFAAFTGAARHPIGALWTDPATREVMIAAFREVEAVARAEAIAIPTGLVERIVSYVDTIPGETRSSLLIDLQQGKPIELEALLGAAVRRGARVRVPTPIMAALYAVMKPFAGGERPQVPA